MPFGVHPLWLFLLLLLVLIIFGPGKLPELGAGVGKAMREFRKATSDLTDEVKRSTSEHQGSAATGSEPASSAGQQTTEGKPSEAPKS